jgi:prepilin-type N-terminal cleavage/methylation domain-containing protein
MYNLLAWYHRKLGGRKGQQGFTLIELLVVVTILGVLAGIVTLSLVGLTTNANTQACRSEYKTVQAALDAFMADNQVDAINNVGPTHDMTTQLLPTGGAVPKTDPSYRALFNPNPSASGQNFNYTRNGVTQWDYTWDTHGKITNTSGPCQSSIV